MGSLPIHPIRSAPSFHASPDSRSRPRASRPRPHRSHAAMESCGGCAGPVNGVAQGGVPGCGLRDGVLHLPFLSCVRQVLQKVFPKNSVLECRSPSGLWECGKAERSWRSFSKPQRESVPFGGLFRQPASDGASPFCVPSTGPCSSSGSLRSSSRAFRWSAPESNAGSWLRWGISAPRAFAV